MEPTLGMSDAEFLKKLNISDWPDADNYKETQMEDMLLNPQDLFNDDLNYFDENPEESPFSDVTSQLEAETQENEALTEIKIQISALIKEFLEYATEDDLDNFLDSLE